MGKNVTISLIIKDIFYGYGDNSLSFAFCEKPDENNISYQRHLFVECREELCRQLIREIRDFKSIDLSKLRILVRRSFGRSLTNHELKKYKTLFKRDISNGIKILNAYEKDNGWDLTKIITDSHDGSRNQFNYLIEGSNNWLKAPFLISLWSLMLRLGVKIKTRKGNYKSSKNVKAKLEKWSKKSGSDDSTHVRCTLKYWNDLIAHHSEIIGKIPERRLFNENHVIDGVTRLCLDNMKVNRSLYKNLIKIHMEKEKD